MLLFYYNYYNIYFFMVDINNYQILYLLSKIRCSSRIAPRSSIFFKSERRERTSVALRYIEIIQSMNKIKIKLIYFTLMASSCCSNEPDPSIIDVLQRKYLLITPENNTSLNSIRNKNSSRWPLPTHILPPAWSTTCCSADNDSSDTVHIPAGFKLNLT